MSAPDGVLGRLMAELEHHVSQCEGCVANLKGLVAGDVTQDEREISAGPEITPG